ncbi:hypothetical protein ADM99_03210 [Leptolinea tardivitalis]|uniref:Uncharacterized protein n=1 Tax=Leptolinea tardivitalis TaxID=229920 RepID=A0A0P6WSQ2_9CHLR|nr:hypothetical protein ADM99_03210 [Leptolinea tardivitalis]
MDCACESQFEWTTEYYYAALLEDGSLWRWHFHYGLDTIVDSSGKGLLAGLIIGMLGLFFWKYRRKTAY